MRVNEVILGIDPGSSLGLSICELDHFNQKMYVHKAYTFFTDNACKNFTPMPWEDIRDYKFLSVENEIRALHGTYFFTKVCTENNYLRSMANAYKSLIECVCAVKNSVNSLDPSIPLIITEPGVIKNCMGIGGNDGDKDKMREAMLRTNNIVFCPTINPKALDEHAVDSVCIAYHQLMGAHNQI